MGVWLNTNTVADADRRVIHGSNASNGPTMGQWLWPADPWPADL